MAETSGPVSWRDVYTLVEASEKRAVDRHGQAMDAIEKVAHDVKGLQLARAHDQGVAQQRDRTLGISRGTLALVVSMIVPTVLLVTTLSDLVAKALGFPT